MADSDWRQRGSSSDVPGANDERRTDDRRVSPPTEEGDDPQLEVDVGSPQDYGPPNDEVRKE
jgi:hypothetical protein